MSSPRHTAFVRSRGLSPPRHDTARVHDIAAAGTAGRASALPHLAQIQKSFGPHYDLTRVKAYSDDVAAHAGRRIGADAYAFGERIAFAGMPSLHTAAHEAAHVIQQRAGVRPPGGIGRVGDRYERAADAVGRRVVEGRSSQDLLAPYAGARETGSPTAVQMTTHNTSYGTMTDTCYEVLYSTPPQTPDGPSTTTPPRPVGVDIKITFAPNQAVDARKIALTQAVRATARGKSFLRHIAMRDRVVEQGPGEGYRIDRSGLLDNNPILGAPRLGANQGLADTPLSDGTGNYQLGFRFYDGKAWRQKNAETTDKPEWSQENRGSAGMEFETTAVAIEGSQSGTHYGSVSWGWNRNAQGELSKLPFEKVSDGTPSEKFLAAAERWNSATLQDKFIAIGNPTQFSQLDANNTLVTKFEVQPSAPLQILDSMQLNGVRFAQALPADPAEPITLKNQRLAGGIPQSNKPFYVASSQIAGVGGIPTVDLPSAPPAAEAQAELQRKAASFSGIKDAVGQDPDALARLDSLTVVLVGGTDGDSMAMRTDLSGLVDEIARRPQRVRLRVCSINPDVAGNAKAAAQAKSRAGSADWPQALLYRDGSFVSSLQGYDSGHVAEIRKMLTRAGSRDALTGMFLGIGAGVLAGAVIGGIVGGLTAKDHAAGAGLGVALGSSLGSMAGLGIGAAIGHWINDDIGRSRPSESELKEINRVFAGGAPKDAATAVMVVDHWIDRMESDTAAADKLLRPAQRQMLVSMLLAAGPKREHQRAILKIIEYSDEGAILRIFSPREEGAPDLLKLEGRFDGAEKAYLQRLLERLRDLFPVTLKRQDTKGLMIERPEVKSVMEHAFTDTHDKPPAPPVKREWGGVFLMSTQDAIVSRTKKNESEEADIDVGKMASDAYAQLAPDFLPVATFHTHPLTQPALRQGDPEKVYPIPGREAPSAGDFKAYLEAPAPHLQGGEHYVIGGFVTYLMTRAGDQQGFRMLGNTADLLNVRRFQPKAGQKSALELG